MRFARGAADSEQEEQHLLSCLTNEEGKYTRKKNKASFTAFTHPPADGWEEVGNICR